MPQNPVAYDPLTGEPIAPKPQGTRFGDLRSMAGPIFTTMVSPTPRTSAQRESDYDMATNALPVIGGTIGGLLGAPSVVGAVGTAALGGAAGEALKQTINNMRGRTPVTGIESVERMATEGAVQGGAQAIGAGVGKAAASSATWLMNRALNLTDKLAREFPDMSEALIEKAITVSKGGLKAARDFMLAAKAEANAALAKAHQAGATVPVTAATDGLKKTVKEVLDSSDIEGGLKAIAKVEQKLLAGRSATLTPMEADALKRSLQVESKALYAARAAGQGKPNLAVKARAKADMAKSLNAQLDAITTAAGADGYRAANAEAQAMIGAERGVNRGMRPGSNLYQAMVRPGVGAAVGGTIGYRRDGVAGGMAGTVVGAALMSPTGMSRLAVALTNPAVQFALRQAPRLAEYLREVIATGAQPEAVPSPDAAKAWAKQEMASEIGRDPSDAEIDRFLTKYPYPGK